MGFDLLGECGKFLLPCFFMLADFFAAEHKALKFSGKDGLQCVRANLVLAGCAAVFGSAREHIHLLPCVTAGAKGVAPKKMLGSFRLAFPGELFGIKTCHDFIKQCFVHQSRNILIHPFAFRLELPRTAACSLFGVVGALFSFGGRVAKQALDRGVTPRAAVSCPVAGLIEHTCHLLLAAMFTVERVQERPNLPFCLVDHQGFVFITVAIGGLSAQGLTHLGSNGHRCRHS